MASISLFSKHQCTSTILLVLEIVCLHPCFCSNCGDILGPLLSRLAALGVTDADFKDKMDVMSRQIHGYEVRVKQLKV